MGLTILGIVVQLTVFVPAASGIVAVVRSLNGRDDPARGKAAVQKADPAFR